MDYLTQPTLLMPRTANYSAYSIRAEFEPIDIADITGNRMCANVRGMTYFDDAKRAFFDERHLRSFGEWSPTEGTSFYQSISSALLMYRLACLFEGQITAYGPDGYKGVWGFALRHRETGAEIAFGDSKGGATFWTQYPSPNVMPLSLKASLLKLLTILVSDTCPHPYDGLVAGSVA